MPFIWPLVLLTAISMGWAWHFEGGAARAYEPLIFAVLAVGTGIFAYVTLRFTRRLDRLRDVAEHLNLRDLSARVPVEGADAVADLARAFNRMVERLAAEERSRRQLFADVAHEIRHPLAVLMGRLESIQDGVLPLDTEQVLLLHDTAIGLSRLVGDLRDLSLADVGQLSLTLAQVDVGQLLAQVAENMDPVAEDRGVRLTSRVVGDVPPLRADADRLRQVLLNLLANALHHTPEGGTVDVTAWREDGEIALRVADSGPGIAPEDLPHVFERFFRGDRARSRAQGGSGLGLAIVKSLVELHGGSVAADSTPGLGSRFTVRLPMAGPPN